MVKIQGMAVCGLRGPGSAAAASGRAHSLERTTRSLNMLLVFIQGHRFEIYKPYPSPAWAGLVGNNISRYQKFRVFPHCPGSTMACLALRYIILRLNLLHALHGMKLFSVREDSAFSLQMLEVLYCAHLSVHLPPARSNMPLVSCQVKGQVF